MDAERATVFAPEWAAAPASVPPAVAASCGLTEDEWTRMLLDLLPRGAVWPREPDTTLMRFWSAVAIEPTRIQGRDCDLLAESFPCGATELLPDWERALGLPDECTQGIDWTIALRRAFVCAKLATPGGQTAAYYVALAAAYGFDVSVTEHWPWAMGCAPMCDDTSIGNPGFWWTVNVSNVEITFTTVGCWELCDPLYMIPGADVLECVIRRDAPAHTVVNFSYHLRPALWDRGAGWNRDAWTEAA